MAKNWQTEVIELLFYYLASVSAEGTKFSFLNIIELFVINLALVSADRFQIPVLRQALNVICYCTENRAKTKMSEKIIIKNKTNWFITVISSFALLILTLIILIFIPLMSVKQTYLSSAVSYAFSVIPFAGLFTFIIYVWLWNTFGKTILEISPEKVKIVRKNKLFNKPKTYAKSEIQKVFILNLGVEKSKYHTRINYLFSGSNNSIAILKNNETIRLVDWLKFEKANEILEKVRSILNIKNNSI